MTYRKKEITETTGNYKKGYVWAEPDTEEAACYIRRLYDDPEYYRGILAEACKKVKEALGQEKIVQLLEEHLDSIVNKHTEGELIEK